MLHFCQHLKADLWQALVDLHGLPLTSLDLYNCRNIRGHGFHHLLNMPLSNLNLAHCRHLTSLLGALFDNRNLQDLFAT